MFKHILVLVGLSVAAIFFQSQLLVVLHLITKIHDQVASGLGVIFSVNAVGEIVQSVLALLLIPVVIGVLVSIAHFFMKQEHFPHTFTVIWVSWAVLVAAILAEEGRVSNHDMHKSKPAATEQTAQKPDDQKSSADQQKAVDQQKSAQPTTQPAKS